MKSASDAFQQLVEDQLDVMANLRFRRMFGGFGLYAGEIFFGIIHGGKLYFYTNSHTRKRYEEAGTTFFVTPGSRKVALRKYYEVPLAIVEQKREFVRWAREALASVK